MTQERYNITGAEMKKYRVVEDILSKKITQKEAASQLERSARQVRRIMIKVRDNGLQGTVHGLVGKPSNNSLKKEIKNKVLDLWRDKYRVCGFNYAHFTQKLNEIEKIKISEGSVRSLLLKHDLVDKKPKKGRKHRKRRERKSQIGEMLQIDTSPHVWLPGEKKQHMVSVIDDGTSKLLYSQLESADGTLPNMRALDFIIREYGLPRSIYTDRASWFHYQQQGVRAQSTHKSTRNGKKGETQIKRALDQLGIEFIAAYSAQAKGRIERLNSTLQDRFIPELKLSNITDMTEANKFLMDFFLKDHNNRYAVKASEEGSRFIKLANNDILDDILCFKFTSTVRNDNVVSNSKYYKLQLLPSKYQLSWVQAKVFVRLHIDGSITVKHSKSGVLIPFEIIEYRGVKEFKHGENKTVA